MKELLRKEFVLAMHPSTIIFIMFVPLVTIPDYIYLVVFFYTTLAVFMTCIQGRENNDIVYSVSLPVAKKDIVLARYIFTIIIEMLTLAVCVPFMIISQQANPEGNAAGLDANITLAASALLLFALFNLVFYAMYYKNVKKIGIAFFMASIVILLYIIVITIAVFTVPFFRDVLDTPDDMHLTEKLTTLAVCGIIYAAVTFLSYKTSVKNFEKQDI